MVHELKILPEYYAKVESGVKTFEIRINDRDYHKGDTLILREWDHGKYSGRELRKCVNYIYYGDGTYGIPEGVVVMNLMDYDTVYI